MNSDEILKALANPLRREILGWLRDPAGSFGSQTLPFELGVCGGKIYERCGQSASTVSAHMAVLQRAGLVTSVKVGQWVFYKRDEGVIAAFTAELAARL